MATTKPKAKTPPPARRPLHERVQALEETLDVLGSRAYDLAMQVAEMEQLIEDAATGSARL